MTAAKRRPATPASQGPTRTAPDVPIAVDPPPVPPPPRPGGSAPDLPTAPPDAPVPDVLLTAPVPALETTPPTETGQVDAEDRATTQSPRRPLSLYPLPVWPD
jgi:hypothetical protein